MNVAAGAALQVDFSEVMSSPTVTDLTFTVTRAGAPVSGVVTYAGTTATFKPALALALDSSFLATVAAGMTDLAGNALTSKHTWSFSTPERPTVFTTSPEDGAVGVAINKAIEATFSVAMDPATINTATFLVKQGVFSIAGAVSYKGKTATFAPSTDYVPTATVTATLTTGARDAVGTALGQNHVWSFQTGTKSGQGPVALGVAAPFAVLAGDKVANTVSMGTVVTGNLGISPGAAQSGFPPGIVMGTVYVGIAAAPFQAALLTAYSDAANRLGAEELPADIANLTFTPGLYHQATALALSTGSCTLDAKGDPDAVFVFQVGTTLGLAASTKVLLVGGARATNVYWAVGTSATLGASSKLAGTILALTAISLGAGATVDGRLLAHSGSVILDTNVVTVPAP